jgi:hypothetical protein
LATAVSICSNALLMLGDKPISAIAPPDPTDGGTLCANLYPQVRDWVLRQHTWNCAVKRVILAPDATAPAFDYAYQFSMPDDWLRTLQVGQIDQRTDYQQEGRKILCDEAVFYLVYVFQNTVEATYDSMLVHTMSVAMKAALAYPITKSAAVVANCMQELKEALKQARSVDGMDNPPDTLGDFRLFNAGFQSSW